MAQSLSTTSSDTIVSNVRAMSIGVTFAIVTVLFGLVLGLVFGAGADAVKDVLKQSAEEVLAPVYGNDPAKIAPVLDKSWVYLQRAHLHAGAMGTTALVLTLLMACSRASARSRAVVSSALGIGGLGYSVYWMWAGFRAPGMGGTEFARESLDWLAIPTSGMFVFATGAVLVFFLRSLGTPEIKES